MTHGTSAWNIFAAYREEKRGEAFSLALKGICQRETGRAVTL
jgi:hypothetical protein